MCIIARDCYDIGVKMKMKRSNEIFLKGSLLPGMIRYTIPIMLTGWLQLLFNAADLVVVGRWCGSISVAAVGSTGSMTNLVVTLFMGLSVGAGVCVAHGLGSGQDDVVHRTVHTAIPTAAICGVALTFVGMFVTDPLLTAMGTPSSVQPLSALYMRIYFVGVPFNLLYNYAASILRASGDTKSPLIYLSFAGVANVVLNMIFVTLFHMDVAGVAIATAASQAISAVLCLRALLRRSDACKLEPRKMRIYKPQLLKMIRIGIPAGVQGAMFSISNIIIQSSINSFGDILMSGNAAAANIEGFMWVPCNAFQQTCVNFVGQNTGAHQHRRAYRSVWLSLGCVLVTGLGFGLVFLGLGEQLLSIYITDSADAITKGLIRMQVIYPLYFFFGLMEVSTGALRGIGSSFAPMVISIVGICGIRLGWISTIFQVPAYHTPQSLFWSFPISWIMTFTALFTTFLIVFHRSVKQSTSV